MAFCRWGFEDSIFQYYVYLSSIEWLIMSRRFFKYIYYGWNNMNWNMVMVCCSLDPNINPSFLPSYSRNRWCIVTNWNWALIINKSTHQHSDAGKNITRRIYDVQLARKYFLILKWYYLVMFFFWPFQIISSLLWHQKVFKQRFPARMDLCLPRPLSQEIQHKQRDGGHEQSPWLGFWRWGGENRRGQDHINK